jgi:hypothetical protein
VPVVSEFDVLTRLLLPIFTFCAGAAVTFLSQRYWKRHEEVKESAKALADLTADWYNQLDNLQAELVDCEASGDASALIERYVSNRLILPKVIYHLSVVKRWGGRRSEKLAREVELFLEQVTIPRGDKWSADYVECRPPFELDSPESRAVRLAALLRHLDARQQEIARHAAK